MSNPVGLPWHKQDIVQHMAAVRQYRRYLEIATTTTGFQYAAAREAGFDDCVRCLYNCSEEFSDGQPIDFRSADLDISACVSMIGTRGSSFDIVFVDPYHTYECSFRDLREAFTLIPDGGALVVHDCDPPEKWLAAPNFVPGPWCGVTYKAFIDFVLGREDLEYCTVDTDFGCGVIIKRSSGPRPTALPTANDARPAGPQLIANWRAVGNNFDAAFDLFARERTSLLQLVSVDGFRNGVRADATSRLIGATDSGDGDPATRGAWFRARAGLVEPK